jgi:hypothetical protein
MRKHFLMKHRRRITGALVVMCCMGCATVHRATISEIRPAGERGGEMDVKLSEMGFDVQGAAKTTRYLTARHGNKNAQSAGAILDFVVAMSSWAPKTGNPTVSDLWADGSYDELKRRCPNGRVSNVMVVRESAKYPLVSGEIVRIKADCAR